MKTEVLKPQSVLPEKPQIIVDPKSIALQRLIDEVENRGDATATGYNRSYHRHNR